MKCVLYLMIVFFHTRAVAIPSEKPEDSLKKMEEKLKLLDKIVLSSYFGVSLPIPNLPQFRKPMQITNKISAVMVKIKYKNLSYQIEQEPLWYETSISTDQVQLKEDYGNPKLGNQLQWPESHPVVVGVLNFENMEVVFEVAQKKMGGREEKFLIEAKLQDGIVPFDLHSDLNKDCLFLILPKYRASESQFRKIKVEIQNHPGLNLLVNVFESIVQEKVIEALEKGFVFGNE